MQDGVTPHKPLSVTEWLQKRLLIKIGQYGLQQSLNEVLTSPYVTFLVEMGKIMSLQEEAKTLRDLEHEKTCF